MDRKKAIALSFSVPVAWGFSYPLMKIGMDSMNATSIVALRCIIAFVACLLLFHKRAFRINRDLMVRAAIIGAIMATELTCMCLGSSLTSASTAGFLQSLTVVIVPFANAALLLATAPKSNSAYLAVAAARADIDAGLGNSVPPHLQSPLFRGYRYPHDYTYHYVKQQYLPDAIKDRVYYQFGENKNEQAALAYRRMIKEEK